MTEVTTSSPPAPGEKAHAAEVSGRVLWCPAKYVGDTLGQAELLRICALAGVDPVAVDTGSHWISMAQLHLFLREVRAHCADDEAFLRACRHRVAEAFGPLRFAFFAASPGLMLGLAARTMSLVTRVGRCEVVDSSRNHIHIRYSSSEPQRETQLVCLSRQAQSSSIPTLFGFPPATIEHPSCIAQGDEACEYIYHYYTRPRWVPSAVGAFLGIALTLLIVMFGSPSFAIWFALPGFTATLGAVWELRRTHRANISHGEKLQQALRDVAETEAEARAEVFELHRRQRQWVRLMEEQVAERTASLQDVVSRIRAMGEKRVTNIRGFSHDLRNPLAIMVASLALVPRTEENAEELDDCQRALKRMELLLGELADAASTDAALVRVTPTMLEIEPLVERLKRRQRALVFGRDIKVSTFRTREAPDHIRTDELIFDRVIDNLCTNAAKYTERGSIIIELDGVPGYLTVKISDTGRGIDPERIDAIFRPEGTFPGERAARSLGLGLSVVVQLMDSIGGKIEVMSKPGVGTTFWAHFPVSVHAVGADSEPRTADQLLTNVVTIRRARAAGGEVGR